MASFFKKALGVFVEFEDEETKNTTSSNPVPIVTNQISPKLEDHSEAGKFEKYFDKLFDGANFPGPDYYEFFKMMETLEPHIQDEKSRISATFASLSIQGLTKQNLIETAGKYKVIIEKDRTDFERALADKLKSEVGTRQKEHEDLEKKIKTNSEMIQKLTQEITEAQILIGKLKSEVMEQETKLNKNSHGYHIASDAIINKITSDIQKIQSLL